MAVINELNINNVDYDIEDKVTSTAVEVLQEQVNEIQSVIEAGEIYSTDEIKTNKVWTDGKPIYRKTIRFSTISTDFQNPSVIATNVDEVVNVHGSAVFAPWGNTTRTTIPIALVTGSAGIYISAVVYNGILGLVYSVAGASWSFKDAVVTAEYTKN